MSQNTQSALPEATIEIESQDFAAMNGAKISQANDSIQPSENPAPEEIVTARTVSQSPLLKMGVIALLVLAFVTIIGALIGNSMNALNFSSNKAQPPGQTHLIF